MEKKNQWNTGYWIVALLLLLSLQSYWQTAKTVEPVPYSEFEKALAEGRVAEVLVSDRTVTGRLKSPDSRGQDDDRGNEGRTRSCRSPVEVRRALCPRVGEHLAVRCAVVDPASGSLLWRLVLPVPPLRREAGHGRVSQHR
ncbi:ATP-dependent metalloprotease FtsH [Escherichia coli]|uniref:ATP-dependent metalloprotease FtsH n=1 Tax=Escherichia coli TaxID=562 RepID=A0A2X1KEL7_ECOLX|nr:ATP-dependent metalloprotease FtsH [Escherichia coli]